MFMSVHCWMCVVCVCVCILACVVVCDIVIYMYVHKRTHCHIDTHSLTSHITHTSQPNTCLTSTNIWPNIHHNTDTYLSQWHITQQQTQTQHPSNTHSTYVHIRIWHIQFQNTQKLHQTNNKKKWAPHNGYNPQSTGTTPSHTHTNTYLARDTPVKLEKNKAYIK